jgi:hypothetical protein
MKRTYKGKRYGTQKTPEDYDEEQLIEKFWHSSQTELKRISPESNRYSQYIE